MEIEGDQQALAATVGWVARCLPQRTSTPALLGMRLEATPGGLAVAGTDHTIAGREVLGCRVEQAGGCLVPGRMLAEITKLMPGATVRLTKEARRLTIRSGDALYALPLLPLDEYPSLPVLPEDHRAEVDSTEFAAVVGQLLVSAARDEVVPALSGVNLRFSGDHVELATTDRYRLGIARVRLTVPADTEYDVLVPARPLADLVRVFGAEGGPLWLLTGTESFGVRSTRRSVQLRTHTGPYVPYQRIVPADAPTSVVVDRTVLRDVVRRLAIVAQGTAPVWLDVGDASVQVRAGGTEEPTGAETIPADRTGEPVSIAFTTTLLLDAINAVEATHLHLALTAHRKPAILSGCTDTGTPVGTYRHVLVPRSVPSRP